MPGPFTEDEKAQMIDHLGWPLEHHSYSDFVRDIASQVSLEANLTIIRGHLERLNTLQTQIEEASGNFELDQVDTIKFGKNTESRLWAQYRGWVIKLANSLSVVHNKQLYGSGAGRAIV